MINHVVYFGLFLYFRVQTTLRQKNPLHCCLNTFGMLCERFQTTLHRKISCAMSSEQHLIIFYGTPLGALLNITLYKIKY